MTTPTTERCSQHPGQENHCVTGMCGRCWLCRTNPDTAACQREDIRDTLAADPDAVERVVRDYVRWIQTTAHDTSELARARVHAAIGRDARRVLEVVDR